MIPLIDLHCHLLPGLDDGPATVEEALAMCRAAYEDGIRMAVATPHQSERWPNVTNDRIRAECRNLNLRLREGGLPLTLFPGAEVMVSPDSREDWQAGKRLSIADGGCYVLLEMPPGLFVNLRSLVCQLREAGIRTILAHPERHSEFVDEPKRLLSLLREGCLTQVCAQSIANPKNRETAKAVRRWLKKGYVHFLGSDGHSLNLRPPQMATAYRMLCRWIGESAADRICSTNALAVLQGLPLPTYQVKRSGWQNLKRLLCSA